MSFRDGQLHCDMVVGCNAAITHLDEKGFVYCAEHGKQRKEYKRCRLLKPRELSVLREGKALTSYSGVAR